MTMQRDGSMGASTTANLAGAGAATAGDVQEAVHADVHAPETGLDPTHNVVREARLWAPDGGLPDAGLDEMAAELSRGYDAEEAARGAP